MKNKRRGLFANLIEMYDHHFKHLVVAHLTTFNENIRDRDWTAVQLYHSCKCIVLTSVLFLQVYCSNKCIVLTSVLF